MKYEKIDEDHHIYVEEGETERQVLKALVKASFEMACAAGLGWLHSEKDTEMSDENADSCIDLPPRYGDIVVEMDYIQGRQCKTFINKIAEGHFELRNKPFEIDRGNPEPFLERAKEILAGKTDQNASSNSMYIGESLDTRLKVYGYERKHGESDWDFRKRIFPDLYLQNKELAMQFLMGPANEWGEMDKILCLTFAQKGSNPGRDKLIRFAKGFFSDPIKRREKQEVFHLKPS